MWTLAYIINCDEAYPSSFSLLISSPSHFLRLAAIWVGRAWTLTSKSLTSGSGSAKPWCRCSLEDCWQSVSFESSLWFVEAKTWCYHRVWLEAVIIEVITAFDPLQPSSVVFWEKTSPFPVCVGAPGCHATLDHASSRVLLYDRVLACMQHAFPLWRHA